MSAWDHDKRLLSEIHDAGIAAARGQTLVAKRSRWDGSTWTYSNGEQVLTWDAPSYGQVLVVGAGKAAASIAAGLEQVLGDRIGAGCVVVKYDHAPPLKKIRVLEAGHPVPDRAGVAATRSLLDSIQGLKAEDRVFVALTDGASSLLVAPHPVLTLADKAALTQALLMAGASIDEMITVRKRLSLVKAGGLRRAIGPAQSVTLMISDVASSTIGMIGSGPTIPDHGSPGAALDILCRYRVDAEVSPLGSAHAE